MCGTIIPPSITYHEMRTRMEEIPRGFFETHHFARRLQGWKEGLCTQETAGRKTKWTYPVLNPQIRKRDGATCPRVPEKPAFRIFWRVFIWTEKKNLTFFRLLFAAASMILRPVTVEPVKAILSTSIWAAMAAPPTGPREGTVFTTPGGKLIQRIDWYIFLNDHDSPCLPD